VATLAKMLAKNRATMSRPLEFEGNWWHEIKTSSVSNATNASTSPDSYEVTNLFHERTLGGRVRGRRLTLVRRRPLDAEGWPGPVSGAVDRIDGRVKHVAHLVAWYPSTSRRMSTASWRGAMLGVRL